MSNPRHTPHLIAFGLVCLSACNRGSGPPPKQESPPPANAQQPATTPADISHGEASIGNPAIPPPVAAEAPKPAQGRFHRLRLEIQHAPITVDSGVVYDGWTFGGTAPGPVIRVTQGDTVDFTLVNHAPIPHSMDFHAAELAPNKYYRNILPGDSIQYRFVPRVPGAFMYHCGTAPVAAHIANGMYGALIVDPLPARPAAQEFVLVQSEYYTVGKPSALSLDWDKLLGQAPDFVVFNGRAAQYAKHPLKVRVGSPIRLYVVNAGPNRVSSFHIVGAIFEKVFLDGTLTHPLDGVQTMSVPVGGGLIFETRLREPGTYPFVTHAFADATKGAVGVLEAGN